MSIVNRNLILLVFIYLLLLVLSACAKTYKIGELGPAGGVVFYDKGQKTEGWRYLEVSPVEAEFTAPWGFYEVAVDGTGTGIGEGKKNTDILVSMTGDEGTDNASYRCKQLEINGFKYWFLPSKQELDLMYRVLHSQNIGFFKDDWYWSSSVWDEDSDYQRDNQYATWIQRFNDGTQENYYYGSNDRLDEKVVRAVRAF